MTYYQHLCRVIPEMPASPERFLWEELLLSPTLRQFVLNDKFLLEVCYH